MDRFHRPMSALPQRIDGRANSAPKVEYLCSAWDEHVGKMSVNLQVDISNGKLRIFEAYLSATPITLVCTNEHIEIVLRARKPTAAEAFRADLRRTERGARRSGRGAFPRPRGDQPRWRDH